MNLTVEFHQTEIQTSVGYSIVSKSEHSLPSQLQIALFRLAPWTSNRYAILYVEFMRAFKVRMRCPLL